MAKTLKSRKIRRTRKMRGRKHRKHTMKRGGVKCGTRCMQKKYGKPSNILEILDKQTELEQIEEDKRYALEEDSRIKNQVPIYGPPTEQ